MISVGVSVFLIRKAGFFLGLRRGARRGARRGVGFARFALRSALGRVPIGLFGSWECSFGVGGGLWAYSAMWRIF